MEVQQPQEAAALPPIAPEADKYEMLGVPRYASPAEIQLAYRRLALLYHPDRHPEAVRPIAEESFKRIGLAYRTLIDERERRRYDLALERGEPFTERGSDTAPLTLGDMLGEVSAYEHAFSPERLDALDEDLQRMVIPNLVEQLGEQIVTIWRMPKAPVTHQGAYKVGAVVLTNVRVLLPFTFTWEETKGKTRYTHKGGMMPSVVLPQVQRVTIVSEGRVRSRIAVVIAGVDSKTEFESGQCNLGKLLLLARLWGIPVDAIQSDAKAGEKRWALRGPWVWGAGIAAVVLMLAEFFGFGLDRSYDGLFVFSVFAAHRGLWQWAVVCCGLVSAARIWQWVRAYEGIDLAGALDRDGASSVAILRKSGLPPN